MMDDAKDTEDLCNSDGSSLDSIKLVSDNLSERVKLDCTNSGEYYEDDNSLSPSRTKSFAADKNSTKKIPGKHSGDWTASLKLLEGKDQSASESAKDTGAGKKIMTDMTMNSNLMFRSMFFMNDEATRHFLAPPLPPIQPCDLQSEYFQKKSSSQGHNNSSGPSSVTTSSTNTGNNLSATNPSAVDKPTAPAPAPKHRPHNCDECGKTFLMKHHLSTHMRVHTGARPYACPECGKSFSLKHCLNTHMLLHTAERPYKCPECSKSFTLKHHLVSHERVHTRDRPFECTECGQRFPQKRHLSTHIKFHSGERPFSCQVCGESFSREEHLVMHSRFHGGLSPYNCPDCGAGFLRKFELVNHERQHGRNPESCPNCGKEFLQKRTLLAHVRVCGISQASPPTRHSPPRFDTPPRYGESNSPRFSENQFRFSDGQLRYPEATPSTSPMPGASQSPKDKVCKECGETFSSVEGLALHLRLHFGDHSFLADICSLAASLKQTAVNVAASLKKTHICTDCGRGFTQRHGLFQHRQRHANGSCKEKPFACEKCGKSFAQKNHLTLHERQHMDLPRNSLSKNQIQKTLNNRMDEQIEPGETSQRAQADDSSMIHMLSRNGESSGERSSTENPKEMMERVMANSIMMHQNHPDHVLNRHSTESGESNPRGSQSLLNRHSSESHRPINAAVPLVRMHNSGRASDRTMLPHHHHMAATSTAEPGMPCLHPIATKQY